MGRPIGSQNKDKPGRDALRIVAKELQDDGYLDYPKGSLRWIAQRLMMRAGDETAAAREVFDRLDGKVPQAIVGDDEHAPVRVEDEASAEWRAKCVAVLLAAAKLQVKADE